jgi:hypothetical protein
MQVDPASTVRVSHVGDWTIVTARAGYDHDELIGTAEPELARGARVVVDVHGPPADPDGRADVIARLSRAAVGGSAHLAVVERDAAVRERWREAGVAEVHESLDDAVGDVAPAVLDGPPSEHLLPAAGDAILVATDDVSGNPTAL